MTKGTIIGDAQFFFYREHGTFSVNFEIDKIRFFISSLTSNASEQTMTRISDDNILANVRGSMGCPTSFTISKRVINYD